MVRAIATLRLLSFYPRVRKLTLIELIVYFLMRLIIVYYSVS